MNETNSATACFFYGRDGASFHVVEKTMRIKQASGFRPLPL